MGLKPDHWIKKMALEQRMIEPFVDTQVRDGVISYGLSSYGYDIRVADEFKVFQPEVTANKLSDVQCAYVAGMIDSLGRIDYSPPGQGRRSLQLMLTSTQMAVLERLQEMLGTGQIEANGEVGPQLVVGKPADVQYILAQVMPYLLPKRDQAYRTLAELKASKSIVVDPKDFDANSFVDFRGEVCVIPPNSFALSRTVEYFRIPRSALTVCLGKSSYARCFRGDTRVALVDGTAPTLEEMAQRAQDGDMFWGYSIGENGRMIVSLLDSPRYVGRDNLVEVVLDSGESIFCTPDHRFMLRDGRWMEADRLRPDHSLMPLYRSLDRGYEMVYQPLNGYLYPTRRMADQWNVRHGVYQDAPDTHHHHLDHERRNTCHSHPPPLSRGQARNPRAVLDARFSRFLENDCGHDGHYLANNDSAWRYRGKGQGDNHEVADLRQVPGTHDVYCLTVPEAGNFALQSGVFVHNCGIIVNVTPFEPEWEGYVTLEISNTTPLPAKIYANEGIAQVLFFEADDECDVSYADKKGKYQSQQAIVLPRL